MKIKTRSLTQTDLEWLEPFYRRGLMKLHYDALGVDIGYLKIELRADSRSFAVNGYAAGVESLAAGRGRKTVEQTRVTLLDATTTRMLSPCGWPALV